MKTIVVNNPAAQFGGALSILKQFIENAKLFDKKNKYYIFTSVLELKSYETENIKILIIPKQKFLKRLYWDYYGLKKYCEKKRINPDLIISLQNTGVIFKDKKQLLYNHQSLIFSEKKWNILKKQERRYWFYKNIYPFFIKFTVNKNTKIIVQSEWMKNKFSYLLRKKQYCGVEVYAPNINLQNYIFKEEKIYINSNEINIFYPASSEILKNHEKIIEILEELRNSYYEVFKKIKVYFTFKENERKDLYRLIKEKKLDKSIIFLGNLNYNTVVNYYKKTNILIFPSIIESFPLPLIEAASLSIPILVNKTYYSKFLKNYNKVEFCNLDTSSKEWCKLFMKLLNNKEKGNFKLNTTSWKEFFINKIL